MVWRAITIATVLGVCVTLGEAQMGGGGSAGTSVSPAKAFDSQLSVIESEMMGAVKAMPAEKFGFAPSAAIFVPSQETKFETVRTFGQQATHVAQANYSFYAIVGGMKPDVDVKAIGTLTKKEDIVKALGDSFAFAHKAIATITPENALQLIKSPEPGIGTRLTLASFGVSHGFDHYGQMVVYLRMNGIVPPASAQ
jgi:uncharacterized damage-inducible protein DinB